MLKPNPQRVWSAFCIIEPQITLATLIVVLTAVSHGLLVIDAAKLHFYGIKCTLKMAKMRHNARHYCLSLPTIMSGVTEAWSSECNVPGSAGAQVCSCLESHHNWRCSPGLRLSAGRSTCELSPVLFWPQLTQLPVNIIFDQIFPFLNSWKLLFTQSRVQIYNTGGCGPLLKFWSQLFES